MKIISIINQKGGVGKTTTVVNLGVAFTKLGKSVLLLDGDPQGNATSSLGIHAKDLQLTLFNVFLDRKKIEDVMLKTSVDGVTIVPAHMDMSALSTDLKGKEEREFILKKACENLEKKFDYVLIDCPPSVGILTINALCASHEVLIPLQCEYFALEGLNQLLKVVALVKKKLNKEITLLGILLTMFDSRTNLSVQVVEEVRSYFKHEVFDIIIPRNVKLAEAPSHAKSVLDYAPSSPGALAYLSLAREILSRDR